MKTFFAFLCITLCAIVFTACHKDPANNPTLMQIDSLNAALPKEIINSNSYDSKGGLFLAVM